MTDRQPNRDMKLTAVFSVIIFILLSVITAKCGQVTGQIQSLGGQNLADSTITFSISQTAVPASQSVATTASPVTCGTDTLGNVVGITRPIVLPVASAGAAGTLTPSTTYYIQETYWNASGETQAGIELPFALGGAQNSITISAPLLQPASASGYKVYIQTASGSEKLQVTITGWGNATITTLLNVTAPPASNTSTCTFTFNDALIPTYTTYITDITDSTGTEVPGYPQNLYFQGSIVSLATMTPASGLAARFPQPIVSQPTNAITQSIKGPITLNGYSLSGVGTLSSCTVNGALIVGSSCYPTLSTCYAALPSAGGTCWVPPNYTETLAANLVLSKSDSGFLFLGPATITQNAFQLLVNDGVTGAFLVGQSTAGGPAASSSAVKFIYTGTTVAWQFGTSASTTSVNYPRLENLWLDISTAGSSATGIQGYNFSHARIASIFVGGPAGANTQKGITIGNGATGFSGGLSSTNLFVNNCQTAVQLTGDTVESTFSNNIILSGGYAGGKGLDLTGNDVASNVFLGGTISGYTTAVNFGGNASHNVVFVEIDASTTDAAFGANTHDNQITRMDSSGQPIPVISNSGSRNLVKNPGGTIFVGGSFLNSQGASGALTGNSADQTLYTFTIPANSIVQGKGVRIKVFWLHSTGNTSTTYKAIFGGATVFSQASTGVDTTQNEGWIMELLNQPGTQATQNAAAFLFFRTANVANVSLNENATKIGTSTVNFATAITVTITFNVANTDQVTPKYFLVELLQ